jgi:hypothetical protein
LRICCANNMADMAWSPTKKIKGMKSSLRGSDEATQ